MSMSPHTEFGSGLMAWQLQQVARGVHGYQRPGSGLASEVRNSSMCAQ
jgi:hypothetical protein